MKGRWHAWYSGLNEPESYGDKETYSLGEEFLSGLAIEDWGCGKGFFSLVHDGPYVGVDGTYTPYCDIVADLTEYTSNTPGIFMRHVLEHNLEWRKVLDNAVASFTEKMVLVLFTPMVTNTKQIAWTSGVEVPDISFSHDDITDSFDGVEYTYRDLKTNTQYGVERIYFLQK
jgi:hypothetical protein